MAVTVQTLKQKISGLPRSADTLAALAFLERPDIQRTDPPFALHDAPASNLLKTYRIRQQSNAKSGVVTRGFPGLLASLAALPVLERVAIAAFETTDWFLATFWSDNAENLVGFVLVARRTAEDEQERLDWFKRKLT
jgi:hypothetical protein